MGTLRFDAGIRTEVLGLAQPACPPARLPACPPARQPASPPARPLAALSERTNFSVGCYCENASRCHRSLLRELLEEAGATLS
jgi:hypothetical protein